MVKKFLAAGLFLAMAVAGCGGDGAKDKKAAPAKEEIVISVGTNLVAGKFDPTAGYGVWAPDIFHVHLLKVGAGNKLVNDLATKETISDDGLTYTYEIRKDAKFSDGKPLTAKDVAFTFNTTMKKASAADLTMVQSVTAKDATTVEFKLKKVWSTFPFALAAVGIVPEHAYKAGYGDAPVTSSAWKIAEFKKNQQLILVPNEHYYGPKPKFKKVTVMKLDEDAALAAAKSGQLDLVLISSEFAKNKVNGMSIKELPSIDAFGINLPVAKETVNAKGENVGNNITADPAIRKALEIGIDRKTIIKNALNGWGTPAYAANPNLPWSNGYKFEDNKVEEAKKILADAGWKDTNGNGIVDKNGVEAEFVITGRSNDMARYNTVVALADNAKKLGIKIVPKAAPWNECRKAQNIPTCWVFGQPDPIEVYRYYHTSQMGVSVIGNPASISNKEADALIEKGIAQTNREEANKFFKQALGVAEKEVPYLYICYPQATYYVRDGLQIPDLGKIPNRGQGISIAENMNEWSWK